MTIDAPEKAEMQLTLLREHWRREDLKRKSRRKYLAASLIVLSLVSLAIALALPV